LELGLAYYACRDEWRRQVFHAEIAPLDIEGHTAACGLVFPHDKRFGQISKADPHKVPLHLSKHLKYENTTIPFARIIMYSREELLQLVNEMPSFSWK
jgi:hypothetical protein